MGSPNIEIKITIGEAERLSVEGKNLEKLTGRRLRALNINLQKKIKEVRAKAIRDERARHAKQQAKEAAVQEREVEQQKAEEAAANTAKQDFRIRTRIAALKRDVESGVATKETEAEIKDCEKQLASLRGTTVKKVREETDEDSENDESSEEEPTDQE